TRSSPPTPPCPASGSSPPPPRCSARPSTCSASATASAPRSQKPVQHHPETPGKRPCTRITRGNFGLADQEDLFVSASRVRWWYHADRAWWRRRQADKPLGGGGP